MSQRTRMGRYNSQPSEVPSNSQDESTTELINKCIRYILSKMSTHIPIKKADIVKHALHKGNHRTYEMIISRTRQILNEVYGLHLECIDSDSVKRYAISNSLPVLEELDVEEDNSFKKVLTFLILTHIFMSRNSSTDLSLKKFLSELEVNDSSQLEDGVTVEQFITKTLVKQQYICMEHRGGEHEDGQLKVKFSWGPQAEYTVSKSAVLQFAADIYGTEAEYWKDLHQDALEQARHIGNTY